MDGWMRVLLPYLSRLIHTQAPACRSVRGQQRRAGGGAGEIPQRAGGEEQDEGAGALVPALSAIITFAPANHNNIGISVFFNVNPTNR